MLRVKLDAVKVLHDPDPSFSEDEKRCVRAQAVLRYSENLTRPARFEDTVTTPGLWQVEEPTLEMDREELETLREMLAALGIEAVPAIARELLAHAAPEFELRLQETGGGIVVCEVRRAGADDGPYLWINYSEDAESPYQVGLYRSGEDEGVMEAVDAQRLEQHAITVLRAAEQDGAQPRKATPQEEALQQIQHIAYESMLGFPETMPVQERLGLQSNKLERINSIAGAQEPDEDWELIREDAAGDVVGGGDRQVDYSHGEGIGDQYCPKCLSLNICQQTREDQEPPAPPAEVVEALRADLRERLQTEKTREALDSVAKRYREGVWRP